MGRYEEPKLVLTIILRCVCIVLWDLMHLVVQ